MSRHCESRRYYSQTDHMDRSTFRLGCASTTPHFCNFFSSHHAPLTLQSIQIPHTTLVTSRSTFTYGRQDKHVVKLPSGGLLEFHKSVSEMTCFTRSATRRLHKRIGEVVCFLYVEITTLNALLTHHINPIKYESHAT